MGLVFRGVDYRTADAVERERVREELSRVVYPQCVRLFTCNRSEIYYWDPQSEDSVAALDHLFRVASGLESMVLGEYQILGQVKERRKRRERSGRRLTASFGMRSVVPSK